MALTILKGTTQIRSILETETDADSPITQNLTDGYRENIEAVLLNIAGTTFTGDLDLDPTVGGKIYLDATLNGKIADDDLNGQRFVPCSGNARGNIYTIDRSSAGTTGTPIAYCDGDNPYADGVRAADDFRIMYNFQNNSLVSHNHDGTNSRIVSDVEGEMLPFSIHYNTHDPSTHYKAVGSGYTTMLNSKIYIKEGMYKLAAAWLFADANAGCTPKIRYVVGGLSSTVHTDDDSATWRTSGLQRDVSSLSGLQDISVEVEAGTLDQVVLRNFILWVVPN